jgi:outer membrane protein TolC
MRCLFARFSFFALTCLLSLSGKSQPITLQECLQLGLEHNLLLQSAKLDLQNQEKKANLLTAGALPEIALRADLNHSSSNLRQSFSNGIQVEQSGVASLGLSAGADVQWMLFDGLGMFFRFRALKQESQVKSIEVSVQANQHTALISKAFFKARALQIQKTQLDQLLEAQKKQLDLATEKWNAGILPKQTILQLKIEYNKSKMQWIEIDAELKNSLIDLSEKTGFTKTIGSVDTLLPSHLLLLPEIDNSTPNLETTLLIQHLKSEEKWLSLNLQSAKSRSYPTLALNSSFQFSQTDNSAGFSLYNRSFGPTIGLGFRLPLVARNQIQNAIRDADLALSVNKLNQKNLSRFLNLNHQMAIQRFSALNTQLELARANTSAANENMNLTTQGFEKGIISLETLILAQQSWLQSQMQTEELILKTLEITIDENFRLGSLKIKN